MAGKDFKDLIAWQRAMDLVTEVYAVARALPKEELYGLGSQLRRSAVSVPSNIAEGQSRNSNREFLHHLSIAHGSLSELETQLLIAARLQFLSQEMLNRLLEKVGEVGRLIHGLSASLRNRLH